MLCTDGQTDVQTLILEELPFLENKAFFHKPGEKENFDFSRRRGQFGGCLKLNFVHHGPHNRYNITWMLHQIFMYSDNVRLAAGYIIYTPTLPHPSHHTERTN